MKWTGRPFLPAMVLLLAGCATVSLQPPFETIEIERVPGGIVGGPTLYQVQVLRTGNVKVSREDASVRLPDDGGVIEKKAVARTTTVAVSTPRLHKFISILEPYRPKATGMVTETCELSLFGPPEVEVALPNTRREVALSDRAISLIRVPVWTVRWKKKGYESHFEACEHQKGREALETIFSALRVLRLPHWADH